MGNTRYTGDEEKHSGQNIDYVGDSRVARDNRCDAVNGYKKLALLALAMAAVFCFRSYVLNRVVVSGDSMNPSFSDGDVLWARVFDIGDLSRYQVVVADIDGRLVIKRVIGLPGETIQIINGFVYVNGEKLRGDYGYQTTVYGCAGQEVSLGENEYFLMGDNRDESRDSREWGAFKIESIKGVAIFRFFPFWKIGAVE